MQTLQVDACVDAFLDANAFAGGAVFKAKICAKFPAKMVTFDLPARIARGAAPLPQWTSCNTRGGRGAEC